MTGKEHITVHTRINQTDILLESGTNELEIVEFLIGRNTYGINVAKVREIIRFPEATVPVPNEHPSLDGIVDLRGQVVPIINLQRHLGLNDVTDKDASFVIVSEFNNTKIGFSVSKVVGIQRLSWQQIEHLTNKVSSDSGTVLAVIKLEYRMILMLDFEKITSDIYPDSGTKSESESLKTKDEMDVNRTAHTILVVEDSKYIQKIIISTLTKAGYNVASADDGLVAWDKLNAITNYDKFRSIEDHVSIIITDIEMPQMDGLHLIKNIKSHEKLKHIPCIVFSSLISPEMSLKCKSVGAEAEITKPEIADLVALIDSFLLKTSGNSG
ncbi:MAG: chemotaxis protein CheV [Nitrospiraceae bacterium]|nr:MAG: chemotaxis protein CheV [Nitrospiraceae bacterium]